VRDPKGNSFKGSTEFGRRITVVHGMFPLCREFSSGDLGDFKSRFWIASFYEMICDGCFCECESLASMTFDADSKVLQFRGGVFCGSDFTSIRIFIR
jgi:hypothetical protein